MSELFNWEPGQLPTGWRLGDSVRILGDKNVTWWAITLVTSRPFTANDTELVGAIRFTAADRAKVGRWLSWFLSARFDELKSALTQIGYNLR